MDQVLDGKTPIKVVPFDAHDAVVRDSSNYEHQEYPKVLEHDEEGKEPTVVAKDADHEAELAETLEEKEK